ncbi:MAG: hypothetical protein IJX81_06635 [Clostridia bacterium]|nr:hypothetical protein [Clostridia bacterium]
MNVNFFVSRLRINYRRALFLALFLGLVCCLFPFLCSCKRHADYFSYLSEYRNNLLLAETENFSLRVYAVEKEHPFVADGMAGERVKRAEFYLSTGTGEYALSVTFYIGNEKYGGDAAFDGVKREYYYSCAADLSTTASLPVSVQIEDTVYEITAHSVRTEEVLTGERSLEMLTEKESELFSSLTNGKDFFGEIYLRLIYEEAPYYYIGVVDRTGKTTAFLLDAKTGKILAKREA